MEEYICQHWKCLGSVCTADDRPEMHLVTLEAKGITLIEPLKICLCLSEVRLAFETAI